MPIAFLIVQSFGVIENGLTLLNLYRLVRGVIYNIRSPIVAANKSKILCSFGGAADNWSSSLGMNQCCSEICAQVI